jgi:hypothetical protein
VVFQTGIKKVSLFFFPHRPFQNFFSGADFRQGNFPIRMNESPRRDFIETLQAAMNEMG